MTRVKTAVKKRVRESIVLGGMANASENFLEPNGRWYRLARELVQYTLLWFLRRINETLYEWRISSAALVAVKAKRDERE